MTNNRHLTLLKHDVKAWNYWRQENSEIELDFSEANLSNLNLSGVNLSRVNLSRVDLSGTNLKCADLKGANLHKACLANANLSGSDLSEVKLTEANLTRADISYANLENANLTNVNALVTNFKNSILTGACLENWQIDNNTNLEALVCDYFYGKQQKKLRYPQNEYQNFAPGEYYRFIRNDFNALDALVATNNNSKENKQQISAQKNNILEPGEDNWREEAENLEENLIDSNDSSPEKKKQSKSIIHLSLALAFGIIVVGISLGQLFNKTSTSSDSFITCDPSLLKQAKDAIFIRDEGKLKNLMKQLEEFNSPLGGFADEQCRQTLYDLKYTYAIQVKATKENNLLGAVEILCELPEQYYQQSNHKPWFARWINTYSNTNFPQQLEEYVENNGCPAATYLNPKQLLNQ